MAGGLVGDRRGCVSLFYLVEILIKTVRILQTLPTTVKEVAEAHTNKLPVAEARWIVEEAQAGTRISQHFRRGPTHSEEARVGHFLGELERRLGTNSPTR